MKAKKFLKKKNLNPKSIVHNTVCVGNEGDLYSYFLYELLEEYAK